MDTVVSLADLLAPARGVIAVIGSGGKSTLLARGARELADRGAHAVLATSTHMWIPQGVPLARDLAALDALLDENAVACIGNIELRTGKLTAPECTFGELAARADYVLVEADGARCLPLKVHRSDEPVLPDNAALRVLVVGASGFGQPIAGAVHRPEIFCRLTGAAPHDIATPELVATSIAAEGLVCAHDLAIVNQAETEDVLAAARRFQRSLDRLVWAGSLRGGRLQRLG